MRLAKTGMAAVVIAVASAAFLATSGTASAQQQMNPNMMGPGMATQGGMNPGMMNQGQLAGGQGCPGMMGQNMMGQGMMGGGMMGPGMMAPMMGMMHQGGMMNGGMMGMMRDDDDMRPGMMGGGMMGGAMMGPGMMGGGMMSGAGGAGFVMLPAPAQLNAADVTYNLERMLAARGNPHLKVGKVEDKDADTIVGEVVTTDGSLVERYEVDKRSGFAKLVP